LLDERAGQGERANEPGPDAPHGVADAADLSASAEERRVRELQEFYREAGLRSTVQK
jgi:hypothetical protein